MKLDCLVEAKIRFFLDDDLIEPMPRNDGRPYQAYLVKGKGKEIWIPKKAVINRQIVDQETGEIFDGFVINKSWRDKDINNIKKIRRAKTDYSELPTKYIMV